MKRKNPNKKRGFTLIELLVVIAIIGLLSSIVLASIATAREKAQNSATIQTVRQFQNQLAIYFIDNNAYPNPAGVTSGYCIGSATCPSGPNGIPGNQLAAKTEENSSGSNSFFAFLKPKSAVAALYSIGFAQFALLRTPFIYYCTVSTNPCPDGSAWVYYPIKNGTTTLWVTRKADDTSLTSFGY